jgi:hypothetical protein
MQYPERIDNLTLEQKSENYLRGFLPPEWNITIPNKDYGQDLNIEICEDNQYKGLDLIVQLKSSATSNVLDGNEREQLRVSTYNYLWNNLRVVMIVKYIEDEDEAYWTLLSDVVPPQNPDQGEFTIYLPREQRVSTIDWNDIVLYVRDVTETKLEAADAARRVRARRVAQP